MTKGLNADSANPSVHTKNDKGGKSRIEIRRGKEDQIEKDKAPKNHKENGGKEMKKKKGTEHGVDVKNCIGNNGNELSRLRNGQDKNDCVRDSGCQEDRIENE